jgi:hypothetical protein
MLTPVTAVRRSNRGSRRLDPNHHQVRRRAVALRRTSRAGSRLETHVDSLQALERLRRPATQIAFVLGELGQWPTAPRRS